jgi:hypothetical protein
MVNLACDFSCTERTVSLLEETFLPEKLSIPDCLGLIIINSECCAVAGESKMNVVFGFCDYCKSTQNYEALKTHKNHMLCQYCFQKGNSKLLILLIHICVHISPLSFIRKMVMSFWSQLLSNFVYMR